MTRSAPGPAGPTRIDWPPAACPPAPSAPGGGAAGTGAPPARGACVGADRRTLIVTVAPGTGCPVDASTTWPSTRPVPVCGAPAPPGPGAVCALTPGMLKTVTTPTPTTASAANADFTKVLQLP